MIVSFIVEFLRLFGFKSLIKEENIRTNIIIGGRNIDGKATLTYYPNTRSRLSAGFIAQYGNRDAFLFYYTPIINSYDYSTAYLLLGFPYYNFNTYNDNNNEYWNTRFELIHYYYISPQFRIQTNFSLKYSDNNTLFFTTNKVTTSFGATFSYAFF